MLAETLFATSSSVQDNEYVVYKLRLGDMGSNPIAAPLFFLSSSAGRATDC